MAYALMKKFGVLPKTKFAIPPISRGGGFNPNKEKEQPLTGMVQGQRSAKGEERFARTLEKGIRKGIVREHVFRWTTMRRGVVGYKELDELVFKSNGEVLAISVKGKNFVHRNAGDKEQDRINELIIVAKLREYGLNVATVTTLYDTELETQELADKAGRRLGVYR